MRTDYIKSKDYNKLYMRMSYENALALRTSLETGLRIGDVLSLKKSDISGRTITYTAQKTNKKGKAVVSADLANRLKQIGGNEFVFIGRFGNKPRTRQAVWRDVKQAAKGLFDENVAPHSARKTFAVEDFQQYGLPHTKKALQHERTDTTILYAFSDILSENGQKIPKNVINYEVLAEKIANILIKKIEQMFALTRKADSVILTKKEGKDEPRT